MLLPRYEQLRSIQRTRILEPPFGPSSMRLQRNERPHDWPKPLLDLIFKSIPEHFLQRYPNPIPLYERLAALLQVPQDQILVTSGIDEAIRAIMALTCDPGDVIAVPQPTYAMYNVYARMFGIGISPLHFIPERFTSPEELIEQLPAKCKVLFLPNPGQPVENCFSVDDLRKIAVSCQTDGCLFVVDEAYYFFGGPTAVDFLGEFDNVLIARSFSKAFGAASLRLGYLVGNPRVLAPLAAFRLAHEASSFSIHAGCVLLDHFEDIVKPEVKLICEGRDRLRNSMLERNIPAWGTVSNNVLIDLGANEKMVSITKSLESLEIYVKGSFAKPLDRHILVTCGPVKMMKRFSDALLDLYF